MDIKNKSSNSSATRITIELLHFVPLKLRKKFFALLFILFYHFSPRHRLITIHNLKTSFPGWDMRKVIANAKKAYLNLAVVGAELFDIPTLTKANITDLVEVEGMEKLHNALEKGKGLIISSSHFGNWELSGSAFSIFIKPMMIPYRPLDNFFLDKIIYHIRSSKGNILVPKEKAMMQMLRSLRKNGIVGILVDQNMARHEGVFVNFFHRSACTTDGLAHLALLTEAPVFPMFLLRSKNGKYRLIFGDEIRVINTGDLNSDVISNTQNFTSIIEEAIEQHPEQWLWLHNRWKTKPWQEN